jgi:hypothetical protein
VISAGVVDSVLNMARKARHTPGDRIYHVVNRPGGGRIARFRNDGDFAAFERVMLEARQRVPLLILAWFEKQPVMSPFCSF